MIKDLFAGIKSIVSPGQPMVKSIETYGASGGASVFSLESGGFKPGGRELIAAYNNSPNLRKAVGIIANSLTSTPFYLIKKRNARKGKKAWPLHTRSLLSRAARKKASQETEEIWEHPFLDFLYRGSPLMSGPQALRASYAYREIKGEFFWHLLSGERTPPAAWVVIPPQHVARVPSADNQTFKLQISGHTTTLQPEEVFWSKDLNLSDLWGRGAGVGDSLSDELDTDEYAAQLLRHTLANKGFKDTLISIKAEAGATPRLAEQLEAKYNQRSRSFYNTGRAMVVDGAQVDVKSLTHDLGELKLLDLRNFERDIIHQTFGIPPELFGLVENSNRATIEASEAIFAKMVLVPRLEAMRLELQWKLLPLFDPRGEYLVEFVSPVPGDKTYQLQVMQAAPSAFSVNEWRETAGLSAIDGGDVPLVVQAKPQEPMAPVKHMTKAAPGVAATLSRADIEAILAKISSQDLLDKMTPGWQKRVEEAARVAYDSFPEATGDFMVINPHVRTHMEAFGGQFITGIDETTKARVAATLADGIEAGEGAAQLAKRVQSQMTQIATTRAMLIARTEAVRSANFANQIGWEATGLELQKEWVSALISTTRESHAALHGTVVDLQGDFTFDASLNPNIAESIQQPGNAQSAAHACNCILPGQRVEGNILAGVRSQYSGGIVTINTLKGHKLSVTPNHPILTSRGFVAAGELRKGDYLISYSPEVWASIAANSVNQQPTVIEQVFATLAESGKSLRRGLTANDLHGDASNVVGQVDIVALDWKLMLQDHASVGKLGLQFQLESTNLATTSLSPVTYPGSVIGSSTSIPGLAEVSSNGLGILTPNNAPGSSLSVGIRPQWHSEFLKSPHEGGSGVSRLFAQLQNRGPSFVSSDEIVNIDNSFYSGHVYDLQSSTGWIITQGIAISNCLCTTVAYDPRHESDIAHRIYGSEAHVSIAKGFEDSVDAWERWAYDVMSPYYASMGDEVMRELENRLS